MLPNHGDDSAVGAREDYLTSPPGSPIRRQFWALEAQALQVIQDQKNQDANAGGFLSGAFAALGALGGYLALGPWGVAAGSLLGGAGAAAAGAAAGGGTVAWGAAGAGTGAALGATIGAIADSVIRVRLMSAQERTLATQVFGSTLGPWDQILITDIPGPNNRQFTIPGSALALLGGIAYPVVLGWLFQNRALFSGSILVNMGAGWGDAYNYTTTAYPKPGMLLSHELTHAWQIRHQNTLGMLCTAVALQTRNSLGDDVYKVTPGQQWNQYNLEQQAGLVDLWVYYGMSRSPADQYFRYITANILPGDPNATSIPPPILSPRGHSPIAATTVFARSLLRR
jgi:hypothetical protein